MAMSEAHKAALAKGRAESRAIKRYLAAVSNRKPGRPVTAESVSQRLKNLEEKLKQESDPLKKVDLIQTRLDLKAKLASLKQTEDTSDLEEEFVKAAKSYSKRKGISYTAWREAGVPAAVLKKAGIPRTRSS